ncbi:MAG TPA: fumarate hydratase [Methanothermobacter sp.]|jgi:fumarate hydratase subunit alpha|uniref:Fumarate hydratase n=1 Tax=Methanothermobacter tenebrarum TaxID=680118 RepID=A0ABM7YCN5_9EURY|nr:fumarate hydratase [Methanothermobacter tenebrarum]MDX9692712.1 fumarate hydratase [Methanothermobacter sp.]BDH79091.1 fumarate hydratase [Methanothermobacter tenebrarum]HHW16815.1 fumarate hydratase [Methanothermobacter sp.]
MNLVTRVKNALIKASTSYTSDIRRAYKRALRREEDENAAWVLKLILENEKIAKKEKRPLCDDTGIPHVILEIGEKTIPPKDLLGQVKEGIKEGLKELPGRPMAVKGDEIQRIEQSKGLYEDPSMVTPPSFLIDTINEDTIKVHILMLGGGPEIRARTYRVFHRHDNRKLFEEVLTWMKTETPMLGCTPCIPAIGIGRTHFEATSLMLKAIANGNLDRQSKIEEYLTEAINRTGVGGLGLGGSVTALGSFVEIGPQRASGVRIVSMRLSCCAEPRRATIIL